MSPTTSEGVSLGLIEHQLPFGLLVLDGAGRVTVMNQTAKTLLDRRDGLALGPDRVLVGRPSAEAAELRRRIADVCRGSQATWDATAFSLRRQGSRPPLSLIVIPVSAPTRGRLRESQGAVVLITAPDEQAVRREQLLRESYGLTRAEAHVTLLLLEGAPAQTIAKRRRTSLNTTRTHIRRILDKVGVRSQVDLVRSILTGSARGGGVARHRTSTRD